MPGNGNKGYLEDHDGVPQGDPPRSRVGILETIFEFRAAAEVILGVDMVLRMWENTANAARKRAALFFY